MWYIMEYDHVLINNEQIKHEIQIKNKTRIQFEIKIIWKSIQLML